MKLLFDQNISFKIVNLVKEVFHGCKQVRSLNLENSTDTAIWEYARKNDYCIVTFDSDFIDISTLRGTPPKIIWLRLGNTSTANIATVLLKNSSIISDFLSTPETAFLEINKHAE